MHIDKEIIISQLADDNLFILQDSSQFSFALNVIQVFSNASGLNLNVNKCELMAVKSCALPSICNIPVKERVTYLRIDRCNLIFIPILERTKKKT